MKLGTQSAFKPRTNSQSITELPDSLRLATGSQRAYNEGRATVIGSGLLLAPTSLLADEDENNASPTQNQLSQDLNDA